jgi:cellulose synthase/poly-beta-1,6-N-acetylglucosamine synthase-like glycosyltransferase
MFGLHSLFQAFEYQAFVDFGYLMLLIYFVAMSAVTIYCLLQFHLLYLYKRYHKENPKIQYRQYDPADTSVPFVTVQLPMYNEMYVAERIIDYVAAQEYPKDRFEIHVLDDSTDETVGIVAAKVAALKAEGFNIEHIHRVNRCLAPKAISSPFLMPTSPRAPIFCAPPCRTLKMKKWASCRRAGSTSTPTTAC